MSLMGHKRNTEGIKKHAEIKRKDCQERVDKAIQKLIKEQHPINFKSISEESNVSTSWLYKQPELRERIEKLRQQQIGTPKAKKRSTDKDKIVESQKAIIQSLKLRIKEQEEKIKELEKQVQIAYSKFLEE
jgi:hypothetical protein